MSAFSGKHMKGAKALHKAQKRVAAKARDEALPQDSPRRKRNHALATPESATPSHKINSI